MIILFCQRAFSKINWPELGLGSFPFIEAVAVAVDQIFLDKRANWF